MQQHQGFGLPCVVLLIYVLFLCMEPSLSVVLHQMSERRRGGYEGKPSSQIGASAVLCINVLF